MSEPAAEGLPSGKDEWTGNESIDDLSSNGKGGINPLTSDSPAVANFAGGLLFTYRGGDNDLIYQCEYSSDGMWLQNTAITVGGHTIGTSDGPSLAVFNDTLYMAYRSSAKIDGGYPIMLATLSGGSTAPSNWQGDTPITSVGGKNLPTDHAPSLTVQGTGSSARLWLGWQKDSDLFTATFDGTSWTNNGKIENVGSEGTPQSNYGPVLCGYDSSLWVIFKARHSNQLMWAAYDLTTKLWSGNLDIEVKRGEEKKPKSDRPPGIALFNGSIYIAYKGEDHNRVYLSTLTDQVWSGNRTFDKFSDIDPNTDASPGLTAAVKGKDTVLIMANKGVGNSEIGLQIYVSELAPESPIR